MIRHYEDSGVIRAPRRSSPITALIENDVHVCASVARARRARVQQLADIKALLRPVAGQVAAVESAVKRIARGHIDALQRKIAELQAMARTLEHLAHHCHGDHRPECPIIEELAK